MNQPLSEEQIAQQYPDIYSSLIPLLRNNANSKLETFLYQSSVNTAIPDTKVNAHCYFLQLSGNQMPRVRDFARYLGTRVTDFAIPRSEVKRAFNKALIDGSTAPIDELNAKARSLFATAPTSGEGGELLLSLLAEYYLGLPQLFTKMIFKTNGNVHVHGSDGVHIGVNPTNNNLTLFWGESKLHSDPAKAAKECFESLAPFLLDTGGSSASQNRDLQLMRDGIDLDDLNLENALKKYLDPSDAYFNKLEYRGLCLISFDSDHYPTGPNSKELEQLAKEIIAQFKLRLDHIQKRVKEEKIHTFHIEVFCLPFPSVSAFRDAFRLELGL